MEKDNNASYYGWELLEELPTGWKVDKLQSPLKGYDFCTNGFAPISGNCKRALVRHRMVQNNIVANEKKIKFSYSQSEKKEDPMLQKENRFKVQQCARLKFIEKLLLDIRFDIQVCQLEGWDQREYILQLKNIINQFTNV